MRTYVEAILFSDPGPDGITDIFIDILGNILTYFYLKH